ncbi:MAG: 4-hydroxythreonine-4-phosphate dehydrogenase PdxA [Pseudanabaenaceae cyanobacterium bins.68]|nr:4-hydroxythreonine-4-phosphate dehydrogenase PdxA [Pseudanabaenaceae cyanobacterium bins.68]
MVNSGTGAKPNPKLNNQIKLVITLGDPAGIGSEIVLKAIADSKISRLGVNITIIGDLRQARQLYDQLDQASSGQLANPDHFNWLDLPSRELIKLGQPSAITGDASFRALDQAIALTLEGDFDGIVTAPIAKSAWKLAGHDYPGQTELLAARAGVSNFGMLFVARSPHTDWVLRTLLATVHIPLAQVTEQLCPDLIDRKLKLFWQSLQQDFGLTEARIAIAGINPHSGEQGQLGNQEQAWLNPLIQSWQGRDPHLQLTPPLPPDTLWVKPGLAWQQSPELGCEGYLAMYHDQGLIPVKLLAFNQAVNTTIGLPFVRTSPDHGTAFDLAGQGIADPASMIAAIEWAVEMIAHRQYSICTQ